MCTELLTLGANIPLAILYDRVATSGDDVALSSYTIGRAVVRRLQILRIIRRWLFIGKDRAG